jgi:hypothetical protein
MTNFDPPPSGKPPAPPPHTGCATAFLLVVGVILLLPGVLCAILLANLGGSGNDPVTPVVMLVALCGVGLIIWALTRNK